MKSRRRSGPGELFRLRKSRAEGREEHFQEREIKDEPKVRERMEEALNFDAESEANELLRVDLNRLQRKSITISG